uniref:Uncharacterized protein n=1 Tax=Arundo donax TaxID=35708 RepID=A0A0A9F3M4_ARUDO
MGYDRLYYNFLNFIVVSGFGQIIYLYFIAS